MRSSHVFARNYAAGVRFPRREWSIFNVLLWLRFFGDRVYDQPSGSNGESRRALLSPSEIHLATTQANGM
jgi:hypothetical protein